MKLLMALLQAAFALRRSAALRTRRVGIRARTTLRATPDEWALPPGWAAALEEECATDRHPSLRAFVAAERNTQEVYPPPESTLAALRAVDLEDVEVVIVGQDPYPGKNQAHGLCFSVQDLSTCIFPPSLRNVLREASRTTEQWPEHPDPAKRGDLSRWASSQGVLLLNSVLTVRRGAANSHAGKGWEAFTDAVVKAVAERERGVVFALWGNAAKRKVNDLGGQHRVVSTSHPSPLSAAKGRDAFMGSDCFSRINTHLTELGRPPVRGPA
jgi:uracil-DNA glycosylase